jgi:hypothetical protein
MPPGGEQTTFKLIDEQRRKKMVKVIDHQKAKFLEGAECAINL